MLRASGENLQRPETAISTSKYMKNDTETFFLDKRKSLHFEMIPSSSIVPVPWYFTTPWYMVVTLRWTVMTCIWSTSYATSRVLSALIVVLHNTAVGSATFLVKLGVPFTIRTDHQALKWLKSLPEPTGRKARWLETLAEYTFTIVHRPGRQHSNADALSRRAADVLAARSSPPSPVSSVSAATLAAPVCAAEHASPVSVPPPDPAPSVPVSFPSLPAHTPAELRAAQLLDPDIATALQWYDSDKQVFHRPSADSISGSSRSVHRYASEVATFILLDDVLYRQPDHQSSVQFVVPYSLQDDCISSIHTAPGGGHFGLEKTLQKCQQRFFWPGQSSTVRLFVHACDVCATSKKTAAKPAPLQSVTAGYPGQLVTSLGHVF